MKKLLLIIALLPLIAKSQKCYNKQDPFTGKIKKIGQTSLIASIGTPAFWVMKTDSLNTAGFIFEVGLYSDSFDAHKMLMLIKFENGVIKRFLANKDTKVAEITNGVLVGFSSDITQEDLVFIKANPIDIIRLSYKGEDGAGYDTKVSVHKAKLIMESVDCVLN